jgi:hypothetical protein
MRDVHGHGSSRLRPPEALFDIEGRAIIPLPMVCTLTQIHGQCTLHVGFLPGQTLRYRKLDEMPANVLQPRGVILQDGGLLVVLSY